MPGVGGGWSYAYGLGVCGPGEPLAGWPHTHLVTKDQYKTILNPFRSRDIDPEKALLTSHRPPSSQVEPYEPAASASPVRTRTASSRTPRHLDLGTKEPTGLVRAGPRRLMRAGPTGHFMDYDGLCT